jgi:hypothetical protein
MGWGRIRIGQGGTPQIFHFLGISRFFVGLGIGTAPTSKERKLGAGELARNGCQKGNSKSKGALKVSPLRRENTPTVVEMS